MLSASRCPSFIAASTAARPSAQFASIVERENSKSRAPVCQTGGSWINWTTLSALQSTMRSTARSEEHTSELQSLMRISYAVFCLKKKTHIRHSHACKQHLHTIQKLL